MLHMPIWHMSFRLFTLIVTFSLHLLFIAYALVNPAYTKVEEGNTIS